VPPQIAIAIFAGSIVSFVGKVSHLAATDPAISGPAVAGFVLTLAVGALAMIMPLKAVLSKALAAGPVRAGAATALVVAALPLQLAGMPMAFWALGAGCGVAALFGPNGLLGRLELGREAATAR
jgi:predicted benzoate:H+ symporter BenE